MRPHATGLRKDEGEMKMTVKRFLVVVVVLLFGAATASEVVAQDGQDGQQCPTTNFPVMGGCEADPNYFVPKWGNSPWSVTDWFAPTTEQVSGVLAAIERETGACVALYNDAHELRLSQPSRCVKIVHNIVYSTQLLMGIFPPWYNPTAVPGTYRLVLAPNFLGASNNFVMYGLWKGDKPWMALYLARLAASGAVVITTNMGGAYSFFTPRFQDEISYLWGDLARWWAIDTKNIIALGASRGGIISLLLAERFNGSNGEHRFTDIFAGAPVGLKPGTQLVKSSIPVYYGIGLVANIFGGNENAFRSSGKRFDTLEGITGTRNPIVADKAGIYANAKKLRGVNLHIAIGTHDLYQPFSFVVDFEKRLVQKGIVARFYYVLNGGHGDALPLVAEAAIACVQSGMRPCAPPQNERAVYTTDGAAAPLLLFTEDHTAPLGFATVTAPYRLEPGSEGEFEIAGQPGLEYGVIAEGVLQQWGRIPKSGRARIRFSAPAVSFDWYVDFLKPDGEFVGTNFFSTIVGSVVGIWDYRPPHKGMGNAAFGEAVVLK